MVSLVFEAGGLIRGGGFVAYCRTTRSYSQPAQTTGKKPFSVIKRFHGHGRGFHIVPFGPLVGKVVRCRRSTDPLRCDILLGNYFNRLSVRSWLIWCKQGLRIRVWTELTVAEIEVERRIRHCDDGFYFESACKFGCEIKPITPRLAQFSNSCAHAATP